MQEDRSEQHLSWRCILQSWEARCNSAKFYRAALCRPRSVEDSMEPNYSKEMWVLGPWTATKRIAEADRLDFSAAYARGRESHLYQQLRRKFPNTILEHSSCRLDHWEIEVQTNPSGLRFSRAVLSGYNSHSLSEFTIDSPWQHSRTTAERGLRALLEAFERGGCMAAAFHRGQLGGFEGRDSPW